MCLASSPPAAFCCPRQLSRPPVRAGCCVRETGRDPYRGGVKLARGQGQSGAGVVGAEGKRLASRSSMPGV